MPRIWCKDASCARFPGSICSVMAVICLPGYAQSCIRVCQRSAAARAGTRGADDYGCEPRRDAHSDPEVSCGVRELQHVFAKLPSWQQEGVLRVGVEGEEYGEPAIALGIPSALFALASQEPARRCVGQPTISRHYGKPGRGFRRPELSAAFPIVEEVLNRTGERPPSHALISGFVRIRLLIQVKAFDFPGRYGPITFRRFS